MVQASHVLLNWLYYIAGTAVGAYGLDSCLVKSEVHSPGAAWCWRSFSHAHRDEFPERKTMPVSLLLIGCGMTLLAAGGVLLVTKKRRIGAAVLLMVLGAALIIVFPILIILSSM